MIIRKACINDLEKVIILCDEVVRSLNSKGIYSWDKNYPSPFLKGIIENNNLYIFEENSEIIAVFEMKEKFDFENDFIWSKKNIKKIYFSKFFVSLTHQGKGYSKKILDYLFVNLAKDGYSSVRLDVWDKNAKAISLYLKMGFNFVEGEYYYKEFKMLGMEKVI